MTTQYFLGLPKAEFVWHGAWSDFEIIYNDHSYDGNEIQDVAYEYFQEDIENKYFKIKKNEDENDAFIRWAKECPDRVYDILEYHIPMDNFEYNNQNYVITKIIKEKYYYSICKLINTYDGKTYMYGIIDNDSICGFHGLKAYNNTLYTSLKQCNKIANEETE